MYADGARMAGHSQFLHHSNPCQCYGCVNFEPPYPSHGEPGYRPPPTQMDQPLADCMRDVQVARFRDAGGRALKVDRRERGSHRSPQRRPVFAGQGPYSHPDDLSHNSPWDLHPVQWRLPPEPGTRHYPSVREHCGCVLQGDTGAHPFNAWPPQPVQSPPQQFRGQASRHRRTVHYLSEAAEQEEGEEEEEEDRLRCFKHYHLDLQPQGPQPGHLHNGHRGPKPVYFEGAGGRDNHHGWSGLEGGSKKGYNGYGCIASHGGFFPTEVPQKHLQHSRRKGPFVPVPDTLSRESSKATNGNQLRRQSSDPVRQRARQETIQDQIRQVVTDLEGVLGGLKQVHVEMKEVVEQIDHLTANIDLSDESPAVAHGASSSLHATSQGDLRLALVPHHRAAPVMVPQSIDQNHIILRTNAPSPVHMASVVKTNRVTQPGLCKDISRDRSGMNGHPPHLVPTRDPNHVGETHAEPPPRGPDPTAKVRNSASASRTQKPPPYPQNGRCERDPCPPPNPLKTPSFPGKRRQSTSMV